ncbi:MAG: heparinase II/III family protein [Bacteroidota bacterium]|nr:heparinase II/III family protein [Bacteroidota bacterium]
MRKFYSFFLLLLLPFFTNAQLKYLQNVNVSSSHPRLLLGPGEEQAIRNSIATNKIWQRVHQTILNESDRIISLPPLERKLIGRRLLDKSRECIRRIFFLSYSYRMTHDAKYLKKVEAELLNIAAFSDWHPDHFLDVAEMTLGVSIGYDWLYNDLSKSSRDLIREAILKKGIQPSLDTKYNSWLRVTHNWNQVCNTGVSFGALATYEDHPDLSKQIIERAIESIQLPMGDYNPDGVYPEGYGYWGYGTSFNVLFLNAIEKALGSDFGLIQSSKLLKTAGFMENMTGNTGKCFNYSDCGSGSDLNPAMFWLAKRANNLSLLYSEKRYLTGSKRISQDRLLPAIMIWGSDIDLDNIKAPSQLLWAGKGKNPVVLMRSSWSDPNAIYVAIKGGSPSINHAHMDIGSFVMDANGERWVMDFGSQDYESLESKGVDLWNMKQESQRWQVLRYNNFHHSTLAFDHELQLVKGHAPLMDYSANPSFLNGIFDLTQVYSNKINSAHRGIAIVDQKYVMVRDEIEAKDQATTMRWNLVTPADVKLNGNGTALLTQNGKKLLLKVIEPANAQITTTPTTPLHDYDSPNPGSIMVGFDVKVAANSKCAVTVLLLPEDAKENSAQIEDLKNWNRK